MKNTTKFIYKKKRNDFLDDPITLQIFFILVFLE